MGAAEGHCSIGVNAHDGEGADRDGIELGSGAVVPSHDEVVDLEIMGDARGVGLQKARVDLKLACVAKGKEVSNVGDVDKHVMSEGNRTRSLVVQSGASNAAHSVHSDS